MGTLADVVANVIDRVGATPKKDSEQYIALDDMPSRSLKVAFRTGAEVTSSIVRFQRRDILFGSMRPDVHKVALAPFDGITRTIAFVLRPRTKELMPYALMHVFQAAFVEFATTSSVGTTIPYAMWDALKGWTIAQPPKEIVRTFEGILLPLIRLIHSNLAESKSLGETCDTLLPELLSGGMDHQENAQ